MITISISEEVENMDDLSMMLQHIADMVDKGYTIGFTPNYEVFGEEEESQIELAFQNDKTKRRK